jgi:hypothetical protein
MTSDVVFGMTLGLLFAGVGIFIKRTVLVWLSRKRLGKIGYVRAFLFLVQERKEALENIEGMIYARRDLSKWDEDRQEYIRDRREKWQAKNNWLREYEGLPSLDDLSENSSEEFWDWIIEEHGKWMKTYVKV